jgi:hypothetical protein
MNIKPLLLTIFVAGRSIVLPACQVSSADTSQPKKVADAQPEKCPTFGEKDRESCRATCEAENNRKTAPLEPELFSCERTRDIERSGLHEDECHAQCDRDHNPDSFNEDACHRACDGRVTSCHRSCGNDACHGWCDTDVKHGCHASCSGQKNQIDDDRMGCHHGCSGRGNAITQKYLGCKAGVDGKRNGAEAEMKGCYASCDGKFNFAQECWKKGRSAPKPTHYCYCETRDPKHPNEGTGQTFTRAVETCTVCLGACGPAISQGCL